MSIEMNQRGHPNNWHYSTYFSQIQKMALVMRIRNSTSEPRPVAETALSESPGQNSVIIHPRSGLLW